jgi:dCMP deaminase
VSDEIDFSGLDAAQGMLHGTMKRAAEVATKAILSRERWHQRAMDIARTVAMWSKDPSTQCGAVIMDDHHRILGTGYNGFARGVADLADRYADREVKSEMIVHAEVNAIVGALAPVRDANLIVTTVPCPRCMGVIIQAGIKTVVCPAYAQEERMQREPWKSGAALTEAMCREARVTLVTI